MNTAEILIIIPAYNAAPFLEFTLDSVHKQTFPHWRCVVVDDCSNDESANIVDSWTRRDGRFELVRQVKNGGMASSRNLGFDRLGSESFVIFLDADDTWVPSTLSTLYQRICDESHVIGVYAACTVIDGEGNRIADPESEKRGDHGLELRCGSLIQVRNDRPITFQQLIIRNPIMTPGLALIRTSAIKSVLAEDGFLFDQTIFQCADWDMWIRLSRLGPWGYIDLPLINYRRHSGNHSKMKGKMAQHARGMRRKVLADAQNSPEDCQFIRSAYRAWWRYLAFDRIRYGFKEMKNRNFRKSVRLFLLAGYNYIDYFKLISFEG